MENYNGYELRYYPAHDNRYQTFKARPYDNAEYYWAYTYDKENWVVAYNCKVVVKKFVGSFENVIDFIEEKNKNIKERISHW